MMKIPVLFALLLTATALHAQESSVKPKGYYSSDFIIDSIPRYITFYIPAGFGTKDNYPLMFVLHDDAENAKTAIKKYSGIIEPLADSSTCIVVYMDAVKMHWNTRIGAGAAGDTINDVGFANIMINYFVQQYYCDAQRIYIMGFNNGGAMAWRMACNLPKHIAAIAPFTAALPDAQKACAETLPYFNTDKYTGTAVKKYSTEAIKDAWEFLMKQGR